MVAPKAASEKASHSIISRTEKVGSMECSSNSDKKRKNVGSGARISQPSNSVSSSSRLSRTKRDLPRTAMIKLTQTSVSSRLRTKIAHKTDGSLLRKVREVVRFKNVK